MQELGCVLSHGSRVWRLCTRLCMTALIVYSDTEADEELVRAAGVRGPSTIDGAGHNPIPPGNRDCVPSPSHSVKTTFLPKCWPSACGAEVDASCCLTALEVSAVPGQEVAWDMTAKTGTVPRVLAPGTATAFRRGKPWLYPLCSTVPAFVPGRIPRRNRGTLSGNGQIVGGKSDRTHYQRRARPEVHRIHRVQAPVRQAG
jgi:hypothetical protein